MEHLGLWTIVFVAGLILLPVIVGGLVYGVTVSYWRLSVCLVRRLGRRGKVLVGLSLVVLGFAAVAKPPVLHYRSSLDAFQGGPFSPDFDVMGTAVNLIAQPPIYLYAAIVANLAFLALVATATRRGGDGPLDLGS